MDLAVIPPLRRPLRSECAPDALRDRLAEHVEASALDLLDPERIEAMAEDIRVIERKRVHHGGLVVCAFELANALSGVYAGNGQSAELKLQFDS